MIYRFGKFQLDENDFRLSADGVAISLEPKALRLLLYLIQNHGRLVRKGEILDAVWGDANVSESTLTRSIGLVRKALADDSREPHFIETVPTAGYRFIATVEAMDDTPAETAPVPSQLEPPLVSEPAKRKDRWLGAAIVMGVLLLVISTAVALKWWQPTAPIRSLAVLPLENLSGDPNQGYFADGMTDELITELASIPNLRVVSRTSVMKEKGSHKSLAEIAGELHVDAIVEGSIVRSGDRVRITAQLIDARRDKHLWAKSFEGTLGDIVSVQDDVARQIAAQARVALTDTTSFQKPVIKPEAHDAYLRGRYFLSSGDLRRSVAYFQQAITLEPAYASAYAGLADALEAETTFGLADVDDAMTKAMAAAQRAIELDPKNGEAYTALGSNQTIYKWDWPEAQRNLLRGIALSPSYSVAEMKYAVYLGAVGRPDEAVTHMRRSLSLDPLSFWMTRRLGATLYLARDYDGAIRQLQRAAEIEPNFAAVDMWLSHAYIKKGWRDEAINYNLAALVQDWKKIDAVRLRMIYHRDGWNAFWLAQTQALLAYQDQACASYPLGLSYLLTNDTDHAFSSFNRAVDGRCLGVVYFQTEPLLDSIRSDPRYKRLLHRINLPAS